MAKITSQSLASLIATSAALAFTAQAFAAPPAARQLAQPRAVVAVDADCYAIGQSVAAEKGGTLAKASPDTRGGKAVCVIVVVVPGKDGKHGQRQEIVVPAG